VATETLKWDSFLTEGDRKHLDGFREIEWPNIRRVLYQAPYENIAPKGVEPHWVLPGKAVYWQEQIVREHVELKDDEGIPYRDVLEVSAGWQPTGPLPANNASVIAHYLRKGFRLRPPGREDVEVEEMVPTGSQRKLNSSSATGTATGNGSRTGSPTSSIAPDTKNRRSMTYQITWWNARGSTLITVCCTIRGSRTQGRPRDTKLSNYADQVNPIIPLWRT